MKSKVAQLAFALTSLLLALVPAATAGSAAAKPTVIRPVNHDISAPLRDLATSPLMGLPSGRIVPLRPMPPLPRAKAPVGRDRALQTRVLALVNTVPGLNFDGIGADGVAPPDTTGAVADDVTNQYVQM